MPSMRNEETQISICYKNRETSHIHVSTVLSFTCKLEGESHLIARARNFY